MSLVLNNQAQVSKAECKVHCLVINCGPRQKIRSIWMPCHWAFPQPPDEWIVFFGGNAATVIMTDPFSVLGNALCCVKVRHFVAE